MCKAAMYIVGKANRRLIILLQTVAIQFRMLFYILSITKCDKTIF